MRPCLAHFFQTIRTSFSREKPGVNPSTFGPPNSNPGAAPAWNLIRGGYIPRSYSIVAVPYRSLLLVVTALLPVSPVSIQRGGSGGSDPPFSGLVRPWTPLRYSIAGVKGRPPQGGSLPPQ